MTARIPCGLEDDRIRYEPDEPEEESPLTPVEQRLSWLCEEWQAAVAEDYYDTWRDIRMMVHGALQALNWCKADNRHEDRMALMQLGSVAFEHSLDCIASNKYEGAPKCLTKTN